MLGERRIGLALSSGGARGAAHVGVLKVLAENGIEPDVIVGSSMGAEVGGIYACGVGLGEIESLWRSSSFGEVLKTLYPTIPWSGWSSGNGITRFLRKLIGAPRIEELPIAYAAIATDLRSGRPFTITSGSLVDAIRASLSVPGLFNPVWIDGHLLIDGGVSNPMPVDIVRRLGADVVIGVDVLVDPAEVRLSGIPYLESRERVVGIIEGVGSPSGNGRRFHPNVFSVLFQMSTVFQKRLSDLLLVTHPPDVLLRPDFSADPPCYSDVGCGIEAGEEATRHALPEIRRIIDRCM
jgi:NTE family protein